MSGIAGVIYRTGRPATVADLAPVIEEIGILGPDGISTWAQGNVALAHFALHTTPEAEYEQWPLCNARGDMLIADARLDNREELIRVLSYERQAERVITDADLILAAHERWADDAPTHLVGDFAYALWNGGQQILRLVRSPFGMKGLYYRLTSEGIFFGTTLRGVRVLAPHNLSTNLPWVASFLTLKMDYLFDESVYIEIKKVPPGHLYRLSLANGTQTRQSFWDLIPSEQYATWSDDDWVEAFRECFETAVSASLRSNGPIAMSVSGGLDSSSIALVAHRLMHDELRVPKQPTYTYTLRMKGWPDTEESPYRNAVVARLPHFSTEWIDLERAWEWSLVEQWQRRISTPVNLSNTFTFQPRIDQARRKGCRIMLGGSGGDIITGGEDYALTEIFLSLPWSARLRESPYFSKGTLKGALKFAKELLGTQIPSKLLEWRKKRRKIHALYRAESKKIASGKAPLLQPVKGDSPLQGLMRKILTTPFFLQAFEQGAEVLALQGMEHRCPFYNRRLVEMAFQIPARLRVGQGRTRVLIKRALEQDLPPILQARRSKASFARFTANTVSEMDHVKATTLSNHALTRKQGWINDPIWEKWSTNPDSAMQTIYLHRVTHLENWLSQLDL
ncbi:MAG: asparagine synthetase B family protein [Ardenticatenaceae bacterium]